jgi:glycosyltransferase involved in cell wall biosynthesis
MELPCVTTHITGIPELIENGVTGCLAAPSDVEGLARAVGWLADHPGDARRLGMAGRERVLADYDLGQSVARLAEVFAKRLARTEPPRQ